jgi:hypothetical protein
MLNATPTNSSYSINPPLSSNSRYYWRVRAINASGHYSGWSSVFSFFTPP